MDQAMQGDVDGGRGGRTGLHVTELVGDPLNLAVDLLWSVVVLAIEGDARINQIEHVEVAEAVPTASGEGPTDDQRTGGRDQSWSYRGDRGAGG